MPTEYTVKEAAALLGVSDDTVRRWADNGRIEVHPNASGRRVVDGAALAQFMVDQRDSSALAETFPTHKVSARNRLIGVVTAVTKDGLMAQVEVQAGPFRLVALMSRDSADEMKLEPGMLVVTTSKATNMVLELA